MAFEPKTDYQIEPRTVYLKEFSEYHEEYVTRPPYQRKTVWSSKKKQGLLDSIVRGYYVPKVVLRLVRLDAERTVSEVIDGQQRITTVQEFFRNELRLPNSLKDVSSDLPGKLYRDLLADKRKYLDRLQFGVDRITSLENPHDPEHQRLATEIFWRLQQGESLNQMEVAHARLSSLVRNFLVKYADDEAFDHKLYLPIDSNPHKHLFFRILNRPNDRMQHLMLLARMLLIEAEDGAADLKDQEVIDLIDRTQVSDGIGNESYENTREAKEVLSTLNLFARLFKDDPMIQAGEKVQELKPDYIVLSFFILLRHLRKHYVIGDDQLALFRQFIIDFHERWRKSDLSDRDMVEFTENRQHSLAEVRTRELVIRQLFWVYLTSQSAELTAKDGKRAYDVGDRIAIYRRDEGRCQQCLAEVKSPADALVSWKEYEADHILPHSKGGATTLENGQLLCRTHNRAKSDIVAV